MLLHTYKQNAACIHTHMDPTQQHAIILAYAQSTYTVDMCKYTYIYERTRTHRCIHPLMHTCILMHRWTIYTHAYYIQVCMHLSMLPRFSMRPASRNANIQPQHSKLQDTVYCVTSHCNWRLCSITKQRLVDERLSVPQEDVITIRKVIHASGVAKQFCARRRCHKIGAPPRFIFSHFTNTVIDIFEFKCNKIKYIKTD